MSVNYARTGNVRLEETCDPRTSLAQEKFFSLRPKPLERWLWTHRVSAAAERVFWFHWTEGARSPNWCSQAALHYVAEHCAIDTSTVTRAYQTLRRLGLIRRTDSGRDPSNPFQQATAVTEVLLPRDLVAILGSFPNRPRPCSSTPAAPEPHVEPPKISPVKPANPYGHLDHKAQRAHIQSLSTSMSVAERERWHKAICSTELRLEFDANSALAPEIQAEILAYLASREPPKAAPLPAGPTRAAPTPVGPRQLSVFDVARLRRGLQTAVGLAETVELTRQVLWAIELGALKRFPAAHAINIALKKVRDEQWSRPYRMPPNWVRELNGLA